jgi:hypothetical protein
MRTAIPLLALAAFVAPYARAADLTKIERSLRKEPAYQTKTPKYCLLVFGPEAKTRVWLVLDGKTLYVDRNANGDLTDDGEKIAGKNGQPFYGEDGEILFDIGDIHEGPRTHKKLILTIRKMDYLADRDADVKAWLAKTPQARGLSLQAEVDLPGWKGNGIGGRVEQFVSFRDEHGFLTFADKPPKAPIIHLAGPWQTALSHAFHFIRGREADFFIHIGTLGLGAGTFARIAYEGVIPEQFHPRVEITFPPKHPGETPAKQLFELKWRC